MQNLEGNIPTFFSGDTKRDVWSDGTFGATHLLLGDDGVAYKRLDGSG